MGSMKNGNRLFLSLKGPLDQVKSRLGALQGLRNLKADTKNGEQGFVIETDSERDVRDDVFRLSVEENWPILATNEEAQSGRCIPAIRWLKGST